MLKLNIDKNVISIKIIIIILMTIVYLIRNFNNELFEFFHLYYYTKINNKR